MTTFRRAFISIILLLLSFGSIYAQPRSPQAFLFERLGNEQGLSQGRVISILQDKRGFMWFGTEDGLERYDGISIKVFHSSREANTLPSSYIEALHEDKEGILWVGTKSGLARFDRTSETFVRYRSNPNDPASLPSNYVTSIVDDITGSSLWVGTYGGGLARLDKSTHKFVSFRKQIGKEGALQSDIIWRLAKDKAGTIWVGTYEGGLYRFNVQNSMFQRLQPDSAKYPAKYSSVDKLYFQSLCADRNGTIWAGTELGLWKLEYRSDTRSANFTNYSADPANSAALRSSTVQAVLEDRSGLIWVGTKNGLHLFDREREQFTVFQNDPTDATSLIDNDVLSLYEDRMGILWIGTSNGVCWVNTASRKFMTYRALPNMPTTLSNNVVWSFAQDRQGKIWIGTESGLNRLEYEPLSGIGQFSVFRKNATLPQQLNDDFISALCTARDGSLWIGTDEGGVHVLKETNVYGRGQFTSYVSNDGDPKSLSSNIVSSIILDKQGKIWIGTAEGVNRFDGTDASGKAIFTRFESNPKQLETSLPNPAVTSLCEDKQGFIWVGTDNGLARIDAESGAVKSFRVIDAENADLSQLGADDNAIQQVFESADGTLWLGTQGGLYKFDRASEQATLIRIPQEQAVKNFGKQALKTILGITEDSAGNLWLSTNEGICRFAPRTNGFRFYDTRDGLQSKEFVTGAVFKDKRGNIYFGGVNGFNVMNPDSLQRASEKPPVVITAFTQHGMNVPLDTAISEKRRVVLKYDQNVFEIGFAALSYSFSSRNRYRYKLEGFDNEWHYANTSNNARYTNIDPGDYTFRVQACSYDEIWNEEGASLRIEIPPPFWATWWFRGLIFAVIGMVALVTMLNRAGRGTAGTASFATLIVLLFSEIVDNLFLDNLTKFMFRDNDGLEVISGVVLKILIILFALVPLEKQLEQRLYRFFKGHEKTETQE